MEYAEDKIKDVNDVRYISIRHEEKGVKLYWSLNEVTKKITLVSKDKVVKEDVLMELVTPLKYILKPEVEDTSPAPSNLESSNNSNNLNTVDEDEIIK